MILALDSSPDDALTLLRGTDIFCSLPQESLAEVSAMVTWLHLEAGEVLFRQGDPGDALYVVSTGRLRITRRDPQGHETPIREAGRGENLGELALLTGEPRSGTARAIRDSCVGRLPRDAFDRLAIRHPSVALAMMRVLATWVQRSNLPRESGKLRTIAVVGLEPGAPVAAFSAALGVALARLGPTIVVDRAAIDAALFPGAASVRDDDPRLSRVTHWLGECESAHRFVVYCGDAALPAWTRRCLRQADRSLGLARAAADPRTGRAVLEAIRDPSENVPLCEIVLLQDARMTRPRTTNTWLDAHRALAHHHVRDGDRSAIERIARHLAGTSVGLVLSGGGARGFAHIGVIAALLEAGITIDRVGGTSMGAVIAAQYADGSDVKTMIELNRAWQRNNPLWDLTLPILSLVSGRAGVRILEEMFSDLRIEDLWLDYFCCSTNLSQSQLEVHRRGNLARAVRASISIPGIAPPMRLENGDLLVDGGVLNNMPADVMMQLGSGQTIAVDVAVVSDLAMAPHEGEVPSAWRRFASALGALAGRGSVDASIFSILERTTLVASLGLSQRLSRQVDLYLRPPVEHFGIFEWTALERLVDTGRTFARAEIARWQKSGGTST